MWNRLAVAARLLWRLQPVEPLLLKMESRLSLFTIWRPDCSLCYPTAILPALKIQLWERRGPCKMTGGTCPVARWALPVGGYAFLFCVRLPARREFSPGLTGTAPRYTGSRSHDCLAWLISLSVTWKWANTKVLSIYGQVCTRPRFYSFILQQWIMWGSALHFTK